MLIIAVSMLIQRSSAELSLKKPKKSALFRADSNEFIFFIANLSAFRTYPTTIFTNLPGTAMIFRTVLSPIAA